MWEFAVADSHILAFEAAYGDDGPWVQLFRGDSAYGGTTLLRASRSAERDGVATFVTLDWWTSPEAYAAFRAAHAAKYAAIDAACERLTLSERKLGSFMIPRGPQRGAVVPSPQGVLA